MNPDQIPAKPLWRCVLRKSMSVTGKLVLWASYCVCGVTAMALAVYGALALCSIVVAPMRAFLAYVCSGIAFACSLAAMVPWYAYVGVAAVAAILVYSWAWCVSRELTDEDYQSEIAKSVADLLWLGLLVLWLGLVLWLVLWLGLLVLWLGMVLGLLVLGLLVLWLGMVLWLGETKVFLFIGAYLHYRKRMKEAQG